MLVGTFESSFNVRMVIGKDIRRYSATSTTNVGVSMFFFFAL